MTKREFQATEGLLNDVMRKQAGSLEKAVLEGVMNSIDAGADEIDIYLSEDAFDLFDNGEGLYRSDVETYFEKFGLKDSDIEEKEFGKFRMGRGQIFNFGKNVWHSQENVLVVDLDNVETTVELDGNEVDLDSEGLSYNILTSEGEYEGCHISVDLYNEVPDIDSVCDEVVKLCKYVPWLHDVDITLNGEEIYYEPDEHVETELAYHVIGSDSLGRWTKIYNKGAYVDEKLINQSGGTIITKEDLGVNFARNDILDTCEVWPKVKEEHDELAYDAITSADSPSESEVRWALEYASENPEVADKLEDAKVVEDFKGHMWSPKELSEEKVSVAPRGDKLAEEASNLTGTVFVKESFKDSVEEFFGEDNFREYEEVIEQEMSFEMKEVPYENLSKKRQKNIDRLQWFFEQVNYPVEIKGGHSKHAEVWSTGEGIVYVDRGFLNSRKNDFLTEGLMRVIEVAAANQDTRGGIDHGIDFRRNLWKIVKEMGEPQRLLLTGNW